MKNDEYKRYKESFCSALDSMRKENVFKLAETELRPSVGSFPTSFYRYRTIGQYTDSEILNGTIHLSKPSVFDDVFDSMCFIDEESPGDSVVTNYLNSKSIAEDIPVLKPAVELHEEYFDRVNAEVDNRLRIACFTQRNDNIPMWYYYADKHKGICIEYDLSGIKSYSLEGFIFLPVIYPNKGENNNYKTASFINGSFDISAVRNSLVKSNDWKFEKEWRVIKIGDESDISLKIKGIYLGFDIDNEKKEYLKNLVEDHCLDIPLYEMKKHVTGLKAHKI